MTTANKREAEKIVKKLLDRHLIACANMISPVESHFWWQNKIEKAEELLVLMKSNQKLFTNLSKAIRELHSYKVPEIFAIPIVKSYRPYTKWLNASLTDSGEP
jgi:periplasmic divalent cation tolerance protein